MTFSYNVVRYPWVFSHCGRCGENHGCRTLGFSEKIASFNNPHDAVVWMDQIRERNKCADCPHYFYTIEIKVN